MRYINSSADYYQLAMVALRVQHFCSDAKIAVIIHRNAPEFHKWETKSQVSGHARWLKIVPLYSRGRGTTEFLG